MLPGTRYPKPGKFSDPEKVETKFEPNTLSPKKIKTCFEHDTRKPKKSDTFFFFGSVGSVSVYCMYLE